MDKRTTIGVTAKKKTSKSKHASAKGSANTIQVWEDDPANNVLVSRPVPDLSKKPAFSIPGPKPQTGTAPGTPQFRYWVAAEALRRGADFFAPVASLTRWQPGATLNITLDAGEDLNANYDRNGLNFYHGPDGNGGWAYSGESPDVVCHELGHAMLDAFKPQLWDAASLEVAAFHEAFGDISAILSAIQLPSLRTAVLTETGGHLSRSSRLSRLAEQLGAAIRAQYPDAVEPDCLRNAVNSFSYVNPINLPPSAPASQLCSEPHSFSRLFTGAAFDILAALTSAKAGGGTPTQQNLLAAGNDLARILVDGIRTCPVVSNWYAQLAAAMVQASAGVDAAYPALLKAAFVRRSILSLHSAAAIAQFPAAPAAALAAAAPQAPLPELALPSDHLGLDAPLLVQAASEPRPFAVMSMVAHDSVVPQSAAEAARTFVDDLFRRGRVDYGGHGRPEVAIVQTNRRITHRLRREAQGYRLQRLIFDCALCGHRDHEESCGRHESL